MANRLGKLPRLPDPEQCRVCKTDGLVHKSVKGRGFRWRRRRCPRCGNRWSTWEYVLKPLTVMRAALKTGR